MIASQLWSRPTCSSTDARSHTGAVGYNCRWIFRSRRRTFSAPHTLRRRVHGPRPSTSCWKRRNSPRAADFPSFSAGFRFASTRARRWSSPAPTAPARRRCCACSRACPRPPPARSAGTARTVGAVRLRAAGALAFAGHLPALKDELTAEENLASLLALAANRATRRAIAPPRSTRSRSARQRSAAGARAVAGPAPAHRARAALARPRPLWILDEPLTALDARARAARAPRATLVSAISKRRRSRSRDARAARPPRSARPLARRCALNATQWRPPSEHRAAARDSTATRAVWPGDSLGARARPQARAALAGGTRRAAAVLRDRGLALPSRDDARARHCSSHRPGRALGRGAARVAPVAAAAVRRRLRRRHARADRAVAVPARRRSSPARSSRTG